MYPAHTQLVAKWSSPSIGDQRATGCTDLAASCHSSLNASLTSVTKSPGKDSILIQIKPNYHFMNGSPQVIPVSINWPSGREDQPLAWQAHANNASLTILEYGRG